MELRPRVGPSPKWTGAKPGYFQRVTGSSPVIGFRRGAQQCDPVFPIILREDLNSQEHYVE